MDERSEIRLKKLVVKTPEELKEVDIGFLKARISYLSEPELAKFDSILNQTSKEPVKKKYAQKSR